jgi:hypothetical protein
MAANVPSPRPPQPPEKTAAPAERTPMNWVMVLWLVCFLAIVVFAMISYFAGMFYTPRQ